MFQVSVCGGCSHYYPWAAVIVAFFAGLLYVSISIVLVKLKIDDPLDAVAVHAGSGNCIFDSVFNSTYFLFCNFYDIIWFQKLTTLIFATSHF